MSDQNQPLAPNNEFDILEAVKSIIWKHLNKDQYQAFIYGSRAKGTNRKYSDLDVGIEGPQEIPTMKMIDLEDDFEASDIPYMTEIVDFKAVDPDFYQIAKSQIISLN